MFYDIDKKDLWERTYAEVSRVADEAYTDDGISLYDNVILTEKDRMVVDGLIDDGVSALVRRAFDICKYSPEVHYQTDENGKETKEIAYISPRLVFNVPDVDESMIPSIKEEISRYLSLYAAAGVFEHRRSAVVPNYAERVQAAMDRAIVLLKSRKAPNERW